MPLCWRWCGWRLALSRVGLLRVFLRSLVAIPFILIALPTVFTKPGIPLFELNLNTLHAHGHTGRSGLLHKRPAEVVGVRNRRGGTHSHDPALRLLEALRALRVPAILVAIVMLMYRYLFVLVDEAQSLMRARTARSAAIGPKSGGSLVWRAKSAGGMAGSLFIRTLDRSERIYMAMLARGYDGTLRQSRVDSLERSPILLLAASLCLFVAVAVAARTLL